MGKVDVERAELVCSPSLGRNIAEESRVKGGNDGHLHASIGEVHTADAAFVLSGHAQEVLIGELLGVTGGLKRGHHELILLGDLLLLALLGLHLSDLVLDVVEVDFHGLRPITSLGIGAFDVFFNDGLGNSVVMMTDMLTQLLLD